MKKVLLSIIVVLVFTSAITYAQTADSSYVDTETLAELIIKEAKSYLGKRYSYGGTGGKGFDCSGFTSTVYKKFGYTLPHSSKAQASQGRAVTGPISELQKGDIIILGSRRKSKTVGHVGIFIELDSTGTDFTFIHASTSNGVLISRMKEPYYDGRFLGARRLIPDFVKTDTTQRDYNFDIDNTVAKPDTLKLKESESRILILEDGKWVIVAADGSLSKPSGNDKIVLDYATGNWSLIKTSSKQIPSSYNTPTTVSAPTTSTAATSEDGKIYYTLKYGDTLYALAKKYHTTVKSICSLNNITEKTILKVGRKIRIK